jgi:hypothetical protein
MAIYRITEICHDITVTTPYRAPHADAWLPARPIPNLAWPARIKAAWLVLTGRADALLWESHYPIQGSASQQKGSPS